MFMFYVMFNSLLKQFNDIWLLTRLDENSWSWHELLIHGQEYSPPHLWFHPSCKVEQFNSQKRVGLFILIKFDKGNMWSVYINFIWREEAGVCYADTERRQYIYGGDPIFWKQHKSSHWLSGKVETGAIRASYPYTRVRPVCYGQITWDDGPSDGLALLVKQPPGPREQNISWAELTFNRTLTLSLPQLSSAQLSSRGKTKQKNRPRTCLLRGHVEPYLWLQNYERLRHKHHGIRQKARSENLY